VNKSTPQHPDRKPVEGLFCFKDKDRPCTAECMAYILPPEGPDYKDQQWARCLLLVNTHRTGKHLVVLCANVEKMISLTKTEQADRVRLNQPPVPPVK